MTNSLYLRILDIYCSDLNTNIQILLRPLNLRHKESRTISKMFSQNYGFPSYNNYYYNILKFTHSQRHRKLLILTTNLLL